MHQKNRILTLILNVQILSSLVPPIKSYEPEKICLGTKLDETCIFKIEHQNPILLLHLLAWKFRFLKFWLLLSGVAPYLEFVITNCLISHGYLLPATWFQFKSRLQCKRNEKPDYCAWIKSKTKNRLLLSFLYYFILRKSAKIFVFLLFFLPVWDSPFLLSYVFSFYHAWLVWSRNLFVCCIILQLKKLRGERSNFVWVQ